MKTALSIAGSDSGGGAGIQADLKTMTMNGVFGMSAITALTAQNTVGVSGILEVSPEFLQKQIDAVFEDIRPDAVKIGMVGSSPLIQIIADRLAFYHASCVIVDPVMVATSGAKLIEPEAIDTLRQNLLPLAELATPNLPETEILSGIPIRSEEDMIRAAQKICEICGCSVLCKGGHSENRAKDLFCNGKEVLWLEGELIDNPNTHGTGCTLSAAIAANRAKGFDLLTSIRRAKDYLSGALSAMLNLGKGSGPMNHAFALSGKFAETAEK